MSEKNKTGRSRLRRIRHTGRLDQVFIYLGKQLRFFINQSDWKVLPMAAIIAGLVGMVIRRRFFVNMEGSLIGAFALTCVALWNGCFNSIQSVCRERPIVKREHRSGMHISAYVTAHMIYQFMLCAAQTALTMFVLRQLSVPIPRGYGSGLNHPLDDLRYRPDDVPYFLCGRHDEPFPVQHFPYHHRSHDHHALYPDLPAGLLRRCDPAA